MGGCLFACVLFCILCMFCCCCFVCVLVYLYLPVERIFYTFREQLSLVFFKNWTCLCWSLCTLYLHACQVRVTCTSGRVTYLACRSMAGKSYRRRLRSSLLYLCDVFRTHINSLAC